MSDGLLSLNWNNHGATFCHTLAGLRGKDKYTDVTVSCEGNFYQVHKLVLSTCSEYFEKIFENTPCKHPVIVLRDVQCDELESLLNYMYKGVVSVAQNDLSRLIKVAELLQIKGLAVPDEPPTPSKSGSSKRSNEDRLSPRSSSDSPYPKRRRRRESDAYQSSSGLTSGLSRNHDSHEPSVSEDRDNRIVEDRLYDLPQEPLRSPVTVNVDETLVKEEILDNDDGDEVPETDYGGLDHSGDGSQDTLGLMIPKFDDTKDGDGEPSPVTLPDPVVEALAGPSGLQGWADGGDMTRRMSLAESFASGDSQDMSSSVGLPTPSSGQPPQMVLADCSNKARPRRTRKSLSSSTASWRSTSPSSKKTRAPPKRLPTRKNKKHFIKGTYHCEHCDYKIKDKKTFYRHVRAHKPFICPVCSKRFAEKTYLQVHNRIHTGERPYVCDCGASFNHLKSFTAHKYLHTGEKPHPCHLCPYATIQKTLLKRHLRTKHQLTI